MHSSLTIFEELSISQMDPFTHTHTHTHTHTRTHTCTPSTSLAVKMSRVDISYEEGEKCVSVLSHPYFNICLIQTLTHIAQGTGSPIS